MQGSFTYAIRTCDATTAGILHAIRTCDAAIAGILELHAIRTCDTASAGKLYAIRTRFAATAGMLLCCQKTPGYTVTAFLKEFWLPSLGRDEDLLPDVPLLLLPVPEHVEGLLGHQLPPLHTGYAPPLSFTSGRLLSRNFIPKRLRHVFNSF